MRLSASHSIVQAEKRIQARLPDLMSNNLGVNFQSKHHQKATGDLIVDEIVDIPAEGVDVVVLVNSVGVDLASFGLGVVIPVEIPRVAGTYSIPEDEEGEGRPPKGNPDITSGH